MQCAVSLTALAALACAASCNGDGGSSSPAPRGAIAIMTLNVANGAGDRFRTAESRLAQGAFIDRTAAEIVALQEVDVDVARSGRVDTAAAIAGAVSPGFGRCAAVVAAPPHQSNDGTRRTRCDAGMLLFGVGFRADDPFSPTATGEPSGIIDADDTLDPRGVDRSAGAYFGNALIVRAPHEVEDAFTVALPVEEGGVSAAPSVLLEALGRDARDVDALASLAAHNLATRSRRGIEPRSVLVARVRQSGNRALSVLTTHLESASQAPLRAAQLEAVIAIARAERRGKPDRPVIVMGDLNMTPGEAEPLMIAAGFVRAQATPDATVEIDQIWVDATLNIDAAARALTNGVSDHVYAATAIVR